MLLVSRWSGGVSAGMSMNPEGRGPKPLAEILGTLFAVRGLGRLQAMVELESAWVTAVGPDVDRRTQLGAVRRGVLNVTVAHPALLEELASFRKPEILAVLRRDAPGSPIQDIRFRVGSIAKRSQP